MAADKRNTIIQVNRAAKTAMEGFDDLLSKEHLDRKDLQLIIEKIKVYEDHLEIRLKADIDCLLRCGELPHEEDFVAALARQGGNVNFPDGTGDISTITIVQSAKMRPDMAVRAYVIIYCETMEIYTSRDGEVIFKKYSLMGGLDDFAAQYGYTLTAEDFINKGSLQVTHMPPTAHKRDYMEFTQQFVAGYGKKLVDLVHSYGKRAYVFYDDSWVGVEPYGPHFKEFGFDGVIKCEISDYEVRMCAGVDAPVHELRFHPYLFPVGLGGAPTFAPGGNPTRDAAEYWNHVRRALLRAKIDRIGLGGYLHLLNDFPDFVEYIADISDEFRAIKELHTHGAVATLPLTVAVLHSWGSLRPWTLSGHFHETYMHTLIHINEALAGLPVNVKFINFDDVKNGVPDDVDVIINAGRAGSAWSGGDAWQDETLVAALNKWVYNGGVLLGVEEPSAVSGYGDTFRMARILGVDEDTGARVCHGRWPVQAEPVDGLIPDGATLKTHDHLYMTDGGTRVLAEVDGTPAIAAHAFGKGRGVYMAGFEYSPVNARMLLNLLLWAKGLPLNSDWLTTDPETEAAWFPADKTLVVINNSTQKKSTVVKTPDGDIAVELDGLETKILPQN